MSESTLEEKNYSAWMTKALIVGGVVGALVGIASTYLLIQNRKDDSALEISPGEGVKLGVMVFGLLRSIANLGEGKK